MTLTTKIILWFAKGRIKKYLKENETMAAIINLLNGNTTHLVALLALILGILQGFDVFTVPPGWWATIGAIGLSRLRAGVERNAKELKEGINK